MTIKRILSTTIILLCSFHIFADNVLVGTISEYNAAIEKAAQGDTIFLKNGIWKDAALSFYGEGSEQRPIVLTAQTPGGVHLTGKSNLKIYGKYLVASNLNFKDGNSADDVAVISFRKNSSEESESCRVTNCRIIDFNPSSNAEAYKWVSLYGRNNRVDHCHFEGKNNEGALMVVWLDGQANDHRIDHNYFGKIPDLGRNGGETIRIGTSQNSLTTSRTLVEYNLFDECDGEVEIISNKSCFNVYRYNTFSKNRGTLTLRHGNDCDVYGNYFFGDPSKDSGGVRIIGERHKVYNNYFQDLTGDGFYAAISFVNGVENSPLNEYFQVKEAVVVNNTIVGCKEPVAIGAGAGDRNRELPPLDCIFANNVIDRTTGSRSIMIDDTPINMTYSHNYVYDNNIGVTDDGVKNIDPNLSQVNGIWKPTATSSIVAVSNQKYSYIKTDIEGQSRAAGNVTLGCDEVSTEATTNQVLTLDNENVGVSWEERSTTDPGPGGVTGIDKSLGQNILIYSYEGLLSIQEISTNQLPAMVRIYNIAGVEVFSETLQKANTQINPGRLEGVYFVTVSNENGILAGGRVPFL